MVGKTEPITVLLADDDSDLRTALADLVDGCDGFRVVGSVADGVAAGAVAANVRPRVAVVDVRMPTGGAEAIRRIRDSSPTTAIVVFTALDDPLTDRRMRAAGADVVVVKGDHRTDILAAIETAGTRPRP